MSEQERAYGEHLVALLVRCPQCGAIAGSYCLDAWASGPEETHPHRLRAAAREIAVAAQKLNEADQILSERGSL